MTLHPDKTRLLPFGRPLVGQSGGKGSATFDFLGFTLHWRRSRKGRWMLGLKTRRARLRKAIRAIAEFCRRHRHDPVKVQHAALCRRLRGHFNYFGVNGNIDSLQVLVHYVERYWYKWLRRRSDRTRLNWERFGRMLQALPFPRPRIYVQIWAPAP